MEFKREKRNVELISSGEWRLASVGEVSKNIETIKSMEILESWDIVLLLDGWVDGPGYRYNIKNEYRPNMGHMLLVKTNVSRPSDGSFSKEMYAGVKLKTEGIKAPLLLSCDDRNTEVMCFVLNTIIETYQEHEERQKELDGLMKSLEETFNQGRTVLHYAADQAFSGSNALFIADLVLRNFDFGKELIKVADKYGRTPLHFAALQGHTHLCIFLIGECGLKANVTDRNGDNVLHAAVDKGGKELVTELLKIEDVKKLITSQDAKGKSPLHKAAANVDTDIMDILLNVEGLAVEDYIRLPDLFGQTALIEAASRGHKEAVERLLGKGSNPLLERSSEGKTALHYSVQIANQDTAVAVSKILLQHCKSDEEKLLLLWASGKGMGTAEQSAESLHVQVFLKGQRNSATKSSGDLLLSAIKLGNDALA